ncbi:hypothetical protein AURDEDRAFT_159461 [Auricularia subglabra TFB-10046 SS5]|nr:hypothetical protein AURDEDRAFT_159461 [Auricularia subglabra TFB-10046 SS5]
MSYMVHMSAEVPDVHSPELDKASQLPAPHLRPLSLATAFDQLSAVGAGWKLEEIPIVRHRIATESAIVPISIGRLPVGPLSVRVRALPDDEAELMVVSDNRAWRRIFHYCIWDDFDELPVCSVVSPLAYIRLENRFLGEFLRSVGPAGYGSLRRTHVSFASQRSLDMVDEDEDDGPLRWTSAPRPGSARRAPFWRSCRLSRWTHRCLSVPSRTRTSDTRWARPRARLMLVDVDFWIPVSHALLELDFSSVYLRDSFAGQNSLHAQDFGLWDG